MTMSKDNNLLSTSSSADTAAKLESSRTNLESLILDSDEDLYCEFNADIWSSLRQQEVEKPVLHLQSPELAFRGSLVQRLRKISKNLGLHIGTLHSAVSLLDLFMDAHGMRADRLTHVALACLSLAAKSEEKLNQAPTLKKLASVSGVQICSKTFRLLEWTVCQHVKWKLLAPTPVTFATQLSQFLVTDHDVTSKLPQLLKKYRKDGYKLLEEYLDLTLSDVRLKVMESTDVGCACVACARADLGFFPWPNWLANITGKQTSSVIPVSRLLQRMMKILKSRVNSPELEADQGYVSARTSPNPINDSQSVLDLSNSNTSFNIYYDNSKDDLVNSVDHSYCKPKPLLDEKFNQPSTSKAVKRTGDTDVVIDNKRSRITAPI